ncbi:hypothetical protein Vafri_22075 [Volvox africanus]|uniref:Dynein heavy chain n=1 Tax=Volvox africanus TaxID=51714 RepID=A0A8J4BU65_9CHLO|nr:hypothetical protein Vafri_22075 [Volvox africanus]
MNRRATVMQDWIDMIEKFSAQEEAIRRDMPSEAWLGLVRLDCRGLKDSLAARARELRSQILHWLQSDATDAANTTLVRLREPADVLATGAVDLAALHMVRELLPRVAALVSEVQPYTATMRVNLAIMERFKHPLPDAELADMWTALRLPVVAQELATERLMHMRDNEERCLEQLKRDLDVFSDHVVSLRKRVTERQRLADESQVDKYVDQCTKLDAELIIAIERSQALNRMQLLAGWEHTNYEGLTALRRQLQPYTDLWKLVQGFREMYQVWMYSPLFGFDLDVLETRVPGWARLVAKLDRELKGPPHVVARKYHKRISDFEAFVPLIRALRTNGLRQRHWARLFEEAPALAKVERDIWTLHSLLALRVHEHLVLVRDLADMAARELTIEQSLDKIDSGFHALQMVLAPVPESGYTDVVTLVNGEDLLRFVDDAQLRVRGLATSFYVGPHRDSVSAWDEMLGSVRTILDGWLEVQNRWNHIAPLFGAQAFDEQLPDEGARFEDVTVEWRAVQGLVRRHCKVSELTRHTNLSAQLANMSRKLEGVARGVMEYLDVKRAGFPRFYFLGNLEMVEMMVGSHDPGSVEAFLPKCFPGVRKVGCVRAMPPRAGTTSQLSDAFSEGPLGSRSGTGDQGPGTTDQSGSQERNGTATGSSRGVTPPMPLSTPTPPGGLPGLAAFLPGYGLAVVGDAATRRVWGGPRIESLISNEGEVLPLRSVVELQDARTGRKSDVEVWMSELERQMRGSLKEMLRFALEATSLQPFAAWLLAWPAQCLLACTSINWCRDIHDIYQAGAPFSTPLRRLEELHRSQIHTVVDLLLGGTLSPVQRGIMENMILTKVYHNEVTARLRERRLENDADFEWLKVLRFYLEGPECIAHCGYTAYPYGNEYLGNSPRLVITPLTERAFSSMMAAVHLHYGGAPEGPAGTGKTETVKELAKCLGKQCVVFNTTEQLESGHLTRLLMGIISTGAWACFDEFNRMDMEVLSVVAKQIMVIQTALAAGQRYTVFEGRTMYVNSSLAMFVTMNPMYEHRSVLPSNLKSLFRPVAMMVPDYTMIAEVSLYAAGFQSAQMLATKLVSCLKIAADRLSAQQHYDFQMRTLKSVLLIAAQLRSERALAAAQAKAVAAANQPPPVTTPPGRQNLSSGGNLVLLPSALSLPSPPMASQPSLVQSPLSSSQPLPPLPSPLPSQVQLSSSTPTPPPLMLSVSSVPTLLDVQGLMSPTVSPMVSVASLTSSTMGRPGYMGRANREAVGRLSEEEEAALCKVALLRCNMSKLQQDDVGIFTSMVEREFPQAVPLDPLHATIERYLQEAAEMVGKRATPELVLRALQLHDMLSIRTGILLLGPAACGKTSMWALLQMALSRVDVEAGGVPVSAYDIFPKAVNPSHLYGSYNTTHQHWADGVLTAALRQACSRGAGGIFGRAWLVLDGPVDTRWVEGLNPVLDDNRTLCLSSGEMMPLRDGVSLLLETDTIVHASPATVSRCGVVYMSAPQDLWRSVLDCWLERLTPPIAEYRGKIRATFVSVFPDLLRAYQDSGDQEGWAPRHQPTTIMVAVLKLMDALVLQHCMTRRTESGDRQLQARLEAAMLFATAWAFEPSLHLKSRPFFNILLRQLTARSISYEIEHNGVLLEARSMGFHISLPTEGSVFDYMFDFAGLRWVSWQEHLKALSDWSKLSLMPGAFIPFGFRNLVESHNTSGAPQGTVPGVGGGIAGMSGMGSGPGSNGGKAFILTADNLPAIYVLRTLLTAKCNILLSGPTGVGKTSLLYALLHSAKDWMTRQGVLEEDDDTPPIEGGGTASGGAVPSMEDDRSVSTSLYGGDDAASRFTDMESLHDETSALTAADDLPPVPGAVGGSSFNSGPAASTASVTAATATTATTATTAAATATSRPLSVAALNETEMVSPLDVLYLTLSSQSSARGIKRMLEGLLTRRRRNVLGPPLGKTAVLWVDDVNAAGRDTFDTQV